MKRPLAMTMASAIRRRFSGIEHKVQLHWKGMQLIEEQVRSTAQNNWIMIEYEDFLLRPMEYAPILEQWFHIEKASFAPGLSTVEVRSPDRNILEESWQRIREWDEEYSRKQYLGNMETTVRDMMQKWNENEESIWNNECVIVTPEKTMFADDGFECL